MFFTLDDYKNIERWLSKRTVKDTDFPLADPLHGTEGIPVIQDGKNKILGINSFIEQVKRLDLPDFYNITDSSGEDNITIKRAVELIPVNVRKLGLAITFRNENGNWVVYQFKGTSVFQWDNLSYWSNIVQEALDDLSFAPDEEDLTRVRIKGKNLIKFKDKEYRPEDFSGMGRIILRKNMVCPESLHIDDEDHFVNLLTQQMVRNHNTVYIVQYDFDLDGGALVMPINSVLWFQGGSINNGTLKLTDTPLIGVSSLEDIGTVRTLGDFSTGQIMVFTEEETDRKILKWWNGDEWLPLIDLIDYNKEIQERELADKKLEELIKDEEKRATGKEKELTESFEKLSDKVDEEIKRSTEKDKEHTEGIKSVTDKVDELTGEGEGSINYLIEENKTYINTEINNLKEVIKTDLSDYATKKEVDDRVKEVIGTAPEALDTLGEIADVLSKDSDAISAINGVLAGKADKSDTYTKAEINTKITEVNNSIGAVNSKANTNKSDIATLKDKVATLESSGGGSGNVDLSGYVKSIEIEGKKYTPDSVGNVFIPLDTILWNLGYRKYIDPSEVTDTTSTKVNLMMVTPKADSYNNSKQQLPVCLGAYNGTNLFLEALKNENGTPARIRYACDASGNLFNLDGTEFEGVKAADITAKAKKWGIIVSKDRNKLSSLTLEDFLNDPSLLVIPFKWSSFTNADKRIVWDNDLMSFNYGFQVLDNELLNTTLDRYKRYYKGFVYYTDETKANTPRFFTSSSIGTYSGYRVMPESIYGNTGLRDNRIIEWGIDGTEENPPKYATFSVLSDLVDVYFPIDGTLEIPISIELHNIDIENIDNAYPYIAEPTVNHPINEFIKTYIKSGPTGISIHGGLNFGEEPFIQDSRFVIFNAVTLNNNVKPLTKVSEHLYNGVLRLYFPINNDKSNIKDKEFLFRITFCVGKDSNNESIYLTSEQFFHIKFEYEYETFPEEVLGYNSKQEHHHITAIISEATAEKFGFID